jgi:hypothetical protein
MIRLFPAAALAIALGSAGLGHAEPARPLVASLPDAGPVLDLTLPGTRRAQAFAQSNALRAAGVARTALDHRFSRDDEVVGSLGFLCGLHENLDTSGGARAYGSDPNGRFLGAKLSFAFR